jgi:hypothetical protein
MRYRGGGVGHASTRHAVNHFLNDRHATDTTIATADDESDQSREESDEELHTMDTELEGEPELRDDDPEGEDTLEEEEDDYGYQAEVGNSDNEGGEGEPNAVADEVLEDDQLEDDDEVEGEIEQLGYARY